MNFQQNINKNKRQLISIVENKIASMIVSSLHKKGSARQTSTIIYCFEVISFERFYAYLV